jgi:hypothetical protein
MRTAGWLFVAASLASCGETGNSPKAAATIVSTRTYINDYGALHAVVAARNETDRSLKSLQIECICSTDAGPFSEAAASIEDLPARSTVETTAACPDTIKGANPRMACRVAYIFP